MDAEVQRIVEFPVLLGFSQPEPADADEFACLGFPQAQISWFIEGRFAQSAVRTSTE